MTQSPNERQVTINGNNLIAKRIGLLPSGLGMYAISILKKEKNIKYCESYFIEETQNTDFNDLSQWTPVKDLKI
jgi:hypothetical protein